MAQFRSQATEGSFKANQSEVPDEVKKLESAANRRLTGMTQAQAQVEKNRLVYERAQEITNNLTNTGNELANRLSQEGQQVGIDNSKAAWANELKQNQNRAEEKQNTYKQLTAFSKTAFNLASGIVKKNKDDQLKAINQIALVNSFDSDTLNSISQLDREITASEFQRTDFVLKSLKEGKSQEYVDTVYKHLLKGGGYTNYIENASVLKNQAAKDSSAFQQVIADKSLTPVEKRNRIAQIEAELVANLTVNGKTPSAEFLEQHYFPTLRNAEKEAFRSINGEERAAVEFESTTQKIQQLNVAYGGRGEKKNTQEALRILTLNPTREGINEGTRILLNLGTLEENRKLANTKFEGPNGTIVTLMDYPETAQIIERTIANKERDRAQKYDEEEKLKYALNEVKMEQRYDQLAADGFTEKEYKELERYSQTDEFPISFDSKVLKDVKGRTIEKAAIPELTAQLDEYLETGNATLRGLEAFGSIPPELRTLYTDKINKQAKIRNSNVYTTALKNFDKTIKGTIKSIRNVDYVQGGYNSPDVMWYAGQQRQRFIERVKRYSATMPDTDEAIRLAEQETILDIEKELGAENAVSLQGGIKQYRDLLEADKDKIQVAQLDAKELNAFAGTKQARTAEGWVKFYTNTEKIIEASEQLQRGEPSAFFEQIGRKLRPGNPMAPWEVQAWFAPAVEGMEAIEPPETWEMIKERITAEQRQVLFGNQSSNQQRVQTLIGMTDYPKPVREAYQVGESRPISTFAEQARGQVTFDTGQPGIDVFFEDKKFPAVLPGIVKEVSSQYNADGSGYGNFIVIESVDPETGEPVDVLYGHLADTAQFEQGDSISEGQIIGKQGGTGSVRSVDGTIASIDFLAPAAPGSGSMKPYANYDALRRRIARELGFK